MTAWTETPVTTTLSPRPIGTVPAQRPAGTVVDADAEAEKLNIIATNLTRDHWRKTRRKRRALSSVTSVAAVEPVIYPT